MTSFADPKQDSTVNESLTKVDSSYLICEFLECAIHQILASRRLYDPQLFEIRKLYNLHVKKSLYPQLNDYIHGIVYSLQECVSDDAIEALEILFLDKRRTVVEKVVLEIKGQLESYQFHELEDSFRASLVAIHKSISAQEDLPEGCEFDLAIKTKTKHISSRMQSLWYMLDTDEDTKSQLQYLEPIKSIRVTSHFRIDIHKKTRS